MERRTGEEECRSYAENPESKVDLISGCLLFFHLIVLAVGSESAISLAIR